MAKKKRKNAQATSTVVASSVADATRGTPIWGYERLRKDVLVQLMIDLHNREQHGLSREQCSQVRHALDAVALCASAIPDKQRFRSSIKGKLERFAAAYSEWNDHTGEGIAVRERRRKALDRLSDRRHELAKVERRNWHVIKSEVDLKLVDDMYEALGTLTKALPEIFVNLSKSLVGITAEISKK